MYFLPPFTHDLIDSFLTLIGAGVIVSSLIGPFVMHWLRKVQDNLPTWAVQLGVTYMEIATWGWDYLKWVLKFPQCKTKTTNPTKCYDSAVAVPANSIISFHPGLVPLSDHHIRCLLRLCSCKIQAKTIIKNTNLNKG